MHVLCTLLYVCFAILAKCKTPSTTHTDGKTLRLYIFGGLRLLDSCSIFLPTYANSMRQPNYLCFMCALMFSLKHFSPYTMSWCMQVKKI